MKSCLLCGVGGQGTVLASRVIAAAALDAGLFARTAETIGMAQRGGCVVSHVRIGDHVPSPLIPRGGADVLLGFEPGEAVRCLPWLKEGGIVIVSPRALQPVTAALGAGEYSGADMLQFLRDHSRCHVVDTDRICAVCGSPKVMNVALLGALEQCGALDLPTGAIEKALALKIKPQFMEMNKKALALGAQCVKEEIEL